MATKNYVISHTGKVLGSDKVTLSQNQISPQRETAIISWECPRKYESISYAGRQHPTRFIPRTHQEVSGTADDDTVVSLDGNIQPIAGETNPEEWDYPPVVAYNVTQSTDYTDDLEYDFTADEVTLPEDPADGDTVKLWPILTEGQIKMVGINQLGQEEGALYPWGVPVYKFHDFPQLQAGFELNLHGNVNWTRHEKVELRLDSPRQIVWEDPDYPRGSYVSTIEQDVAIEL